MLACVEPGFRSYSLKSTKKQPLPAPHSLDGEMFVSIQGSVLASVGLGFSVGLYHFGVLCCVVSPSFLMTQHNALQIFCLLCHVSWVSGDSNVTIWGSVYRSREWSWTKSPVLGKTKNYKPYSACRYHISFLPNFTWLLIERFFHTWK